MLLRISALRDLEIIKINDGRRLGPLKDIELDLEAGVIKALVLPNYAGRRLWGLFGRGEDLVVPWERITRIGLDVLLLDLPGSQLDY